MFAVAVTAGCSPVRALSGEHCRNGIDDDADGHTDCADPDCDREYSCAVEQPFDPELPAWLGDDAGGGPDLGPAFEHDCDLDAADDRALYGVGCSLLPDDCGDGLRCVPLFVEGIAVETACVRRGCGATGTACRRVDATGWQTVADACGLEALCVMGSGVGGPASDGGSCLPLCVVGDASCSRCLWLGDLYATSDDQLPALTGLGVCTDPL